MDKLNWRVISSPKNWVESKSIEQLKHSASLRNVVYSVGMPDIHPGKGIPVGAAVLTKETIYPHIIGNDIGCGMAFLKTKIESKKFKQERYSKELEKITSFDEVNIDEYLKEYKSLKAQSALGTIGGGNHFAEFQVIDKVYDKETFEKYQLSEENLMILVHSGSRGLGDLTLREYIEKYSAQNGLNENEVQFSEYLKEHDYCLEWAKINRSLIGVRLLTALGLKVDLTTILDTPHNFIKPITINGETLYIHRKGVSESEELNIIPGSRGTLTYLVKKNNSGYENLYSVPHGAGRKWERSACKGKLENKYNKESIKISKYGSNVICKDKDLLYEEAAESYKNIGIVVNDMISEEIVTVVATFKPVMTVKF